MYKLAFSRSTVVSALLLSTLMVAAPVGAEAPGGSAGKPTPEQIAREADQNMKYLSGHALQKAKALLEAYGDFAPFGAALFPGGKVRYVWAVKPGEKKENLNVGLVLGAVRQALQAQAQNGAILGSAVVYRYLPEGASQPQINVETEYLNGEAVVVATEYEQSAIDEVTFGKATQKAYEPKIFLPEAG